MEKPLPDPPQLIEFTPVTIIGVDPNRPVSDSDLHGWIRYHVSDGLQFVGIGSAQSHVNQEALAKHSVLTKQVQELNRYFGSE